jgi:MerR family transcriptional regulator, redox-sensitive transcriptional activator SoxR
MAVEVRFKSTMTERFLSITEVGAQTGLNSSALRYYENAGLIESAGRVGGRRVFAPGVLPRLAAVALLQEVGFTIEEIRQTIEGRSQGAWRALAEAKLQEIDAHLERVARARELLRAALACGCSSPTECGFVDERRGRHRKVTENLLPIGPPRA